jgi:PAS domain S-box-containing protein
MRGGIFRSIKAYVVTVAVIGTAAMLVATIYFTEGNLNWIAFLTGILIASVLAEAARAQRSEWALMRRTAQLSAMKDKLETEVKSRNSLETKVADVQARLRLMDENLSTRIALIDAEGCCRYHNRAFREWLGPKTELIDGRPLRDLLGSKAYAGIATQVRQSLDGQAVRYEHTLEIGAVCRLAVEHVPQLNGKGRVSGFYFIAEDIARRDDLPEKLDFTRKPTVNPADQDMFVAAFSEQVSGRSDAGKQFISAIQGGEFRLYCQLISPLPMDSAKTAHYEILIRLVEEEGGVMPPGAFFPLAEKNGLMPYLDRWVVEHVLEWAGLKQNSARDSDSIFFINVAAATIGDPDFPDFLQGILKERAMPGSMLCFEVSSQLLTVRNSSVAEFIRRVRECGCRVALSGFGRDSVLFDQIRGFQVEFLKLDGITILNMLGNPVDLAKVVSINRVAKKIGVKTVAEMVESDEIVAKLSEIGVDYAQGFGISRPGKLVD